MSESFINLLAWELNETADLRFKQVAQNPDDKRIYKAAKLARRLAVEVRSLAGTDTAFKLEKMYDLVSRGLFEMYEVEISKGWSMYRSDLGFDRFPDNGQEYLEDLLRCTGTAVVDR